MNGCKYHPYLFGDISVLQDPYIPRDSVAGSKYVAMIVRIYVIFIFHLMSIVFVLLDYSYK
jgi:hypothetical protein